jgi:hypothetical protein
VIAKLPNCWQSGNAAKEQIIMSKRPSLAETMRQVVQTQLESPGEAEPKQRQRTNKPGVGRFHAATRTGKKKVTGNLPPSTHKLLKTLAVQRETTTEALLFEAVGDLLAKYNVRDKAA